MKFAGYSLPNNINYGLIQYYQLQNLRRRRCQDGNEVGFISADPMINNDTGLPVWNVGYAVHPEYRRQGYASSAVMGLSDFLLQIFLSNR